jgi:SLT domain-containing protein
VKHTCTKCGRTEDVPERTILDYIRRSGAFRSRVARLLGQLTGSQGGKRSLDTMTPEARRDRARKAVAAREEKRKNKARDVSKSQAEKTAKLTPQPQFPAKTAKTKGKRGIYKNKTSG